MPFRCARGQLRTARLRCQLALSSRPPPPGRRSTQRSAHTIDQPRRLRQPSVRPVAGPHPRHKEPPPRAHGMYGQGIDNSSMVRHDVSGPERWESSEESRKRGRSCQTSVGTFLCPPLASAPLAPPPEMINHDEGGPHHEPPSVILDRTDCQSALAALQSCRASTSGRIGISVTRTPVRSRIAFPMTAGPGIAQGSPIPFEP